MLSLTTPLQPFYQEELEPQSSGLMGTQEQAATSGAPAVGPAIPVDMYLINTHNEQMFLFSRFECNSLRKLLILC